MSAAKRLVAGYLQADAIAQHNHLTRTAYLESQGHRHDRDVLVSASKAAVDALGTDEPGFGYHPVGAAFAGEVRPLSVAMRLSTMRRVPMKTRLFLNTAGVVAAVVGEGAGIPVVKGNWTSITLEPKKVAAIAVQTSELIKSPSPQASAAIVDDLAAAVALALDEAFLSPEASGSILNGASTFSGTGALDADLREIVERVPGCYKPGSCFVMTPETATYLGTIRDGTGAAAFPGLGPQGGKLLGIDVLTSPVAQEVGSPPTRIVALLDPSQVFWADGRLPVLETSENAALQMSDAAAATPDDLVSMWQTNAVATVGILEASWYARAGAAAYFVLGS